MLKIPPNVAELMIAGLDAEISRQEAIGRVCGDEWPDDYDPNDVAIYRGFRDWLKKHAHREAVIDGGYASKPMRFVMGLIPHFVRQNVHTLTAADVEAAFRVFSEYVALASRQLLESQPVQGEIMHWFSQLLEFPRRSG